MVGHPQRSFGLLIQRGQEVYRTLRDALVVVWEPPRYVCRPPRTARCQVVPPKTGQHRRHHTRSDPAQPKATARQCQLPTVRPTCAEAWQGVAQALPQARRPRPRPRPLGRLRHLVASGGRQLRSAGRRRVKRRRGRSPDPDLRSRRRCLPIWCASNRLHRVGTPPRLVTANLPSLDSAHSVDQPGNHIGHGSSAIGWVSASDERRATSFGALGR